MAENKNIVIKISEKYQQAETLAQKSRELEAKAREIAQKAFQEVFQRELKKAGVEEIDKKHWSLIEDATNETTETLTGFIQEVYDGKFGRGELYFCENNYEFYGPKGSKVVRAIPIAGKEIRRKVDFQISLDELLYPTEVTEGRARLNRNGGTWDKHGYLFLEVKLEGTSNEELVIFARKMLEHGYSMQGIIESFPPGFTPEVSAGEVLNYGYSDHHSGGIHGYAIVLPTGRLAIVTKYDGEKKETGSSYSPCYFWGVTGDATWRPRLRGKYGTLENSEDLESPSQEEIGFLSGREFEGLYLNLSDQEDGTTQGI